MVGLEGGGGGDNLLLSYRGSDNRITLIIHSYCANVYGNGELGWLVGRLQRWADTNVTLAQVIPHFSSEVTDDTDKSDDTDDTGKNRME